MNSLTLAIARLRRLMRLAASVSSLAPTARSRLKTFGVALVMPLRQRIPWLRTRSIALTLKKLDATFTMHVSSRADLVTIEEVLVHDIYAEPALSDPRFIVDLGSNIGTSIVYFRARYPKARILGVEANPEVCHLLRKTVATLPGVEVVQAAVASQPGTVTFYPAPVNYNSSSIERTGPRAIDVPAVTLSHLVGSDGAVDLLKIDVEGAEFDVLTAGLEHVDAITGEFHFGERTTTDAAVPMTLLREFDVRWTGGIEHPIGPWQRVASFVAHRRQPA